MKRDSVYLEHILESIRRIEENSRDGREAFLGSHTLQDAVLTRISHIDSTASVESSALTALRSVGLLSVPYSTLAGPSVARLVRSALPPLRHESV